MHSRFQKRRMHCDIKSGGGGPDRTGEREHAFHVEKYRLEISSQVHAAARCGGGGGGGGGSGGEDGGDLAKSKWKHLRDHFRCELKRCIKSRPGKNGRYRSSWVWFWPLVFLKEQMLQPRYRDGGGAGGGGEESAGDDDTNALSGGDETLAPGDVGGATIKTEPNTSPRAPCKRRRSEGLDRDFLDLDRRNLLLDDSSLPPGAITYDDTEHFLLSLAPAVRTLPLARQMLVRLKIQELVSNEVIACQDAGGSAGDVEGLDGPSVVETSLEIPEISQGWTPGGGGAGEDPPAWASATK